MTDTPAKTSLVRLEPAPRAWMVVLAIVALAVFIVYVFFPGLLGTVTTVGPGCVNEGEHLLGGCTVEVSREVNEAIAIGILVIFLAAGLMAITGLIWTIKTANFEGGPATVESAKPAEVQAAASVAEKQLTDQTPPSDRERLGQLYGAVPVDLWAAAEAEWRRRYRESNLIGTLIDVRRNVGKGNHSYYITATSPDTGDPVTLKVSKGGRGNSGTNVG